MQEAASPHIANALCKHVRWMIRADMDEVLETESLSFEHPWDDAQFRDVLKSRNCIGKVCELDLHGKSFIAGYLVYEMHKSHFSIQNLAVAPRFRQRGIGRALVEDLFFRIGVQRRTRLECHVSERNLDAQLFFKACGFRAEEVVRNFYDEFDQDAYLFVLRHQAGCAFGGKP